MQREVARIFQDAVNFDPLAEQDSRVEFVVFLVGQGVDELEKARRPRVLSGGPKTEYFGPNHNKKRSGQKTVIG